MSIKFQTRGNILVLTEKQWYVSYQILGHVLHCACIHVSRYFYDVRKLMDRNNTPLTSLVIFLCSILIKCVSNYILYSFTS